MFAAAVSAGIATFLAHRDQDDDVIAAKLRENGVEEWLAARLVVYLPIAFGRYLLRECAFEPGIVEGGVTRPLDADPVYRAAWVRAQNPNREEVEVIGLRSADVDAANHLLTDGSKLSDLVFTAPRLVEPLPPMGEGDGGVPDPAEIFAEALRVHGLATGRDDHGWYAGPARFDARVFPHPSPRGVMAQVDFRVNHASFATPWLIESVAGVGMSWRDAIGQATAKFLRGSLHPIVSVLTGDRDAHSDQVQWEPFEHPSGAFDLCLGPQLNFFADSVPLIGPVLDSVLETLKGEPLSRGTHWLRLFFCYQNGQLTTNEVLLDNESFAAGEAVVPTVRADMPERMAAQRVFMMFVPRV